MKNYLFTIFLLFYNLHTYLFKAVIIALMSYNAYKLQIFQYFTATILREEKNKY